MRLRVLWGLAVLAIAGLVAAAAPALAKKAHHRKRPSAAQAALTALNRQTTLLPHTALPAATRVQLLRAARRASGFAAKHPCSSTRELASFRRRLAKAHVRSLKVAALSTASLTASRALLADPRTK